MVKTFRIIHNTHYKYDKIIHASQQYIRLNPTTYCKNRIISHSLEIFPSEHIRSNHMDPYGNTVTTLSFLNPLSSFSVSNQVILEIENCNPFPASIPESYRFVPFSYPEGLSIYLWTEDERIQWIHNSLFMNFIALHKEREIIPLLNQISSHIASSIQYIERTELGVYSPSQTLEKKTGSCRDMTWLLCNILRFFGIASRFVSGYLVQNKDGQYCVDLHAWTEAYLPEIGWLGIDPTSGLFTGQEHIPLFASPTFTNTLPISGFTEPCSASLTFSMFIKEENIKCSSLHFTEDIKKLSKTVEKNIQDQGIKLTIGGEPTFISATNPFKPEWQIEALGDEKYEKAKELILSLYSKYFPEAICVKPKGKSYPNEYKDRWKLSIVYHTKKKYKPSSFCYDDCHIKKLNSSTFKKFCSQFMKQFNITKSAMIVLEEDKKFIEWNKSLEIKNEYKEKSTAYLYTGYFCTKTKIWQPSDHAHPTNIKLNPGATSCYLRIPQHITTQIQGITVEQHEYTIEVSIPKTRSFEEWEILVKQIENIANKLNISIILSGELPPQEKDIRILSVIPDPGVIEVNLPVTQSNQELENITEALYDIADSIDLSTERFTFSGLPMGTGGGNHITLGGPSLEESPFFENPLLLPNMLLFWQKHPSLSYLFSSTFVGSHSQYQRVDEGLFDHIQELELAMKYVMEHPEKFKNFWSLDRLLRHFLVNISGNAHCSEFCIDKFFPPDERNRLGIVELRSFEMQKSAQDNFLLYLLIQGLVAALWNYKTIEKKFIYWHTRLHNEFMLPYFLILDFKNVLAFLNEKGFQFEYSFFEKNIDNKYPLIGSFFYKSIHIELRYAIEPFPTLKENTIQCLDTSNNRIQILVKNHDPSYEITCNQYQIPFLRSEADFVAGIRFKCHDPSCSLQPFIKKTNCLVFDIFDKKEKRSVYGAKFYIQNIDGRFYFNPPINLEEAESRFHSRFFVGEHSIGMNSVKKIDEHYVTQGLLDLRYI